MDTDTTNFNGDHRNGHVVVNDESTSSSSSSIHRRPVLSQDQINEYIERGVLVVNDILSELELQQALLGMESSLRRRGVDVDVLLRNDAEGEMNRDDETDTTQATGTTKNTTKKKTKNNDNEDLLSSVQAFQRLSSTNGSGGVLDIFWDDWKIDLIATNSKLFLATTQLWKAVYGGGDQAKGADETIKMATENAGPTPLPKSDWRWHPYRNERTNFNRGYAYIDRVGYRLPTVVSERWGKLLHDQDTDSDGCSASCDTATKKRLTKKTKKHRSVQRSLTPHLDCCPETYFDVPPGMSDTTSDAGIASAASTSASDTTTSPKKWRPIQCFVALTDTLHPNEGGFECVPKFHHEFYQWATQRRLHTAKSSSSSSSSSTLCVGEYTHIRPKEDQDVMSRIQHIPIRAGAAVFWDNRLPHANSYRNNKLVTTLGSADNDGNGSLRAAAAAALVPAPPRQVVYCSFLPDIALNRQYVANQLIAYRTNQPIRDQWNHIPTTTATTNAATNATTTSTSTMIDDDGTSVDSNLSPLGQKLMGIVSWDQG